MTWTCPDCGRAIELRRPPMMTVVQWQAVRGVLIKARCLGCLVKLLQR